MLAPIKTNKLWVVEKRRASRKQGLYVPPNTNKAIYSRRSFKRRLSRKAIKDTSFLTFFKKHPLKGIFRALKNIPEHIYWQSGIVWTQLIMHGKIELERTLINEVIFNGFEAFSTLKRKVPFGIKHHPLNPFAYVASGLRALKKH